jgi:hypothetical protein
MVWHMTKGLDNLCSSIENLFSSIIAISRMPQNVLIQLIRERTKTRGKRQHDYLFNQPNRGGWLQE